MWKCSVELRVTVESGDFLWVPHYEHHFTHYTSVINIMVQYWLEQFKSQWHGLHLAAKNPNLPRKKQKKKQRNLFSTESHFFSILHLDSTFKRKQEVIILYDECMWGVANSVAESRWMQRITVKSNQQGKSEISETKKSAPLMLIGRGKQLSREVLKVPRSDCSPRDKSDTKKRCFILLVCACRVTLSVASSCLSTVLIEIKFRWCGSNHLIVVSCMTCLV